MLAALIIWVYLAAVLCLYGAAALCLLSRWLGRSGEWKPGLPVVLMAGLVVFGTLAAFLSLFMPLGWLAALLLLAGGVLLFLAVRPGWQWPVSNLHGVRWLVVAVLALAALIVWVNATEAPSNPDTNLYHAQTIHWVESFRAVPGLGNLNGRLAYNSDWLVLNAATSFAFLGLRSFHLLAGLLFLLAVFYFGEGLSGLLDRPSSFSSWLKLLFLPLAFRTLAGEISSPGTDLPVILLTWVLLALAAEYSEARPERGLQRGSSGSAALVVIGLLPAFILTLKLSAAPLLLLSLYAFVALLRAGERRAAWTQAALAAIVLLPWLARSVILSGYLVFPYSRLDLFTFDWKIPASYVDSVREGVIGWARLPNKDWTQAVNMPLQAWLPAWFAEQTLNQRLMILAALVSPLVLALPAMRRYVIPVAVNYVGVFFWIFTAPNLRFGYSFLLAGIGYIGAALAVSLVGLLRRGPATFAPMAAAAVLGLLLLLSLASSLSGDLRTRLLLPADYRKFRTEACAAGDIQLSCATAYKQCGYEPFPCVPNASSGVLPRGAGLQDGFYSVGK